MSSHDMFLQAVLQGFRAGDIGELEVTFNADGDMTVNLCREQKVIYVPQDTSVTHYGREAPRDVRMQGDVVIPEPVTPEDDATRALRLPVQERPSGGR